MNFHCVFYLIILCFKITSDASSLGKRFYIINLSCKLWNGPFFSFSIKAALLIDFCTLKVSFYTVSFFFFYHLLKSHFCLESHWVTLNDHSTVNLYRPYKFFSMIKFLSNILFYPLTIRHNLGLKQACHQCKIAFLMNHYLYQWDFFCDN